MTPKPTALGPRLQWECNQRRIKAGLKPYPGPKPKPLIRKKPSVKRLRKKVTK